MDKSVPTDYHSLIGLVKKALEINNQKQHVLIHCRLDKICFFFARDNKCWFNVFSAGIGRSGVFIALCYLLEAIELRQMLNIKQLVDTMRIYRPHLVQTVVCIGFLYEILKDFDSVFRNNMNIFIGVWRRFQFIHMMSYY